MSPLTVGPVTLRNRVVALPHLTLYGHEDGTASDRHRAYYEERARGGVGLIITEGQIVHPTGWVTRGVRAYDPDAMATWATTVAAVHGHGAKLFAQLTHYGNQTFTEHTGLPAWAPSAVPDPAVGHIPKAMADAEIEEVIEGFALAAVNAADAGFDGVEVKVGHDGLLRQFLSPFSNRRTDRYGGTAENRLRLAVEVLLAIRARVGSQIAVGVRLCLDEGFDGGYRLDDGLTAARHLDALVGPSGRVVDHLSADLGSWMAPETISASADQPPGYALAASDALTAVVGCPVIGFGRIKDPAAAEAIVASGRADLVGLARALIADPAWVVKAERGEEDRIRPCVACNQLCNARLLRFLPIGCVHNPAAGRERTLGVATETRAPSSRRVVVVGGGPAGLKAAEAAARRGHRVTLLEADVELGGQVALAARAPGHGEWGGIVEHLIGEVHRLGVDVRPGRRASEDGIAALAPDVVVLATGAVAGPSTAAVAGAPSVLTPWDVLGEDGPRGARVLLVDTGVQFEGPVLADALAAAGNRLWWVTPSPVVAPTIDPATIAPVRRRVAAAGAEVVTGHALLGVNAGEATLIDVITGTTRVLTGVDHIVIAGPRVPTPGPTVTAAEVHLVGDAVTPRTVEAAILDGERVGSSL